MVLPFEVPASPATTCFRLCALKSKCFSVYQHHGIRRLILSYIAPWRFKDLDAAIAAALGPGGGGEVRLLRNITLPGALISKMPNYIWGFIGRKMRLLLRSKGGIWRLRLHVHPPDPTCDTRSALLGVGRGASVVVRDISFDVCPSGGPGGGGETHLAVLQCGRDGEKAGRVRIEGAVRARHFHDRLVIEESSHWKGTGFFTGE